MADIDIMKPERDPDPAHDLNDTLIRHRAILESRSILGQGIALLKIAAIVAFLYVRYKVLALIDSRRAHD